MNENLTEIVKLIRLSDIPIIKLELSARAYNALKLNGINFLSEFIEKDLNELKKLNFVSTDIAEELYSCAREHLYQMRRSLAEAKRDADPIPAAEKAYVIESDDEDIVPPSIGESMDAPTEENHAAEDANMPDVLDASNEAPTELNDDRPIEALGLSVRAYNCLKRAKIDTVRKLSLMTHDDLAKIRNMGQKSVEEIEAVVRSLIAEKASAADDDSNDHLPDNRDNRPIQELGLSLNTTNALLAARIRTVQALLDCPDEALDRIYNLSKKSKDEIKEAVRRYRAAESGNAAEQTGTGAPGQSSDDRPIEELDLSVRSFNCLKRAGIHTVQQLIDISYDKLIAIRNLGRKSFLELEAIRENYVPVYAAPEKTEYSAEDLKPLILGAFVQPFKGLSLQEIKAALPNQADEAAVKQAVGKLLAEQKIEYVDFRCYKKYPSFYEYLETYLSTLPDREQEIVRRRYAGETLEAIARDMGITRERVRQIQMKNVRNLRKSFSRVHKDGTFDEDYYEALYTKCDLPRSFWSDELGLPQNSISYLSSTFKLGSEKPENILTDEEIPVSLRYRVRNFLDREKVRIDGVLLPGKRADIEEYALRKFAQDEITFDRFIELYNGLLEANGIPYNEKLYYTEDIIRTRSNRLTTESLLCLWKQGERLRYYDIQARDYTELLDSLRLDSYQNTEISTRKLMDLYPELMEKYDIRDPYELHNLLKKIAGRYGLGNVQFLRQPMLQFGVFDRSKAIYEAMIMLSPVTQADLIEYLYQEYGYDRGTAVSYLSPLGSYYHDGVYYADYQRVPDWRVEPLQKALQEDLYFIDEIKSIYTSLFRDADADDINPRSLKAMGFIVNSNYVLQNYPTAEAYFTHLLTKDGVYSIKEYMSRYGSLNTFTFILDDLLHEHRIFRFDKDQIITMQRLERLHVTLEQIDDYCAAVQDYVDDESYFTIESLRQDGFTHPLDILGFDDYFYGYLLGMNERFSFQRINGVITLYNGSIGRFSIADFIVTQLREYDSVDLDEFMQDIRDRYGIDLPDRYTVTQALKGTELYYDDIMDKIYRDKQLYYADLDE